MLHASRVVVCLFALAIVLAINVSAEILTEKALKTIEAESTQPSSAINWHPSYYSLNNNWRSNNSRNFTVFSSTYNEATEISLFEAVTSRIGLPYRWGGTDDRGYDCSGFVWRVFQDAGIEFGRGSARTLWETLPEASVKERRQFGTLIFFNGLSHVGIVRDEYSFYHSSRSQGVVCSYFSDYWGDRIVGYRRVLAPLKQTETQSLDEDRFVRSRRALEPIDMREVRKGKKGKVM